MSSRGIAAAVLVSVAAGAACQHTDPGLAPEVRGASAYDEHVRPFIAEYCLPCHEPVGASGGLVFDAEATEAEALADPTLWAQVRRRLQLGEMPPPGQPRPGDAAIERVLEWIDTSLAPGGAVEAAPVDPGRVTIRRLNRTEYRNTVRDLLGVHFDAVAALPDDEVGYGFDNVGDVLSLPPVLLEKYLDAAEEISGRAIVAEDPENPPRRRFEAESATIHGHSGVWAPFVGLYTNGSVGASTTVPRDGEYVLRARVYADQAGPELARMEAWLDGKKLEALHVKSTREKPGTYEKRVRLERGTHAFAVAFVNDYWEPNNPDPKKRDRNLWLDWLEVAGPVDVYAGAMPASHRRVFFRPVNEDSRVADTRAILERLASRAYRRPARRGEVDRLVELVEGVREGGGRTEAGVQLALQALLVSPHFLFRVESEDGAPASDGVRVLDDYELASRLSYFLWSSMPDDELFAEAAAGTLRANLEPQVRRMLDDPRAGTLTSDFAEQWLQLRRLRRHEPDADVFPEFDAGLREAMLSETLMLVDHVIANDRDVHELLDARYTFLNERLARHYGIEGVTGDRFRKVALTDARRGGILAHASVLTLTSHPARTSPVRRGKWILEQVLASPPPPPPPDVPAFHPGDDANAELTLRERFVRHRSDPSCVSCHASMDPLGFGLENFDAIGRWRERDGKAPVDARGELPNGRTFEGPAELRELLREDGRFVRCVAKKMLTYAIGRGLTAADEPAIDRICGEAAQDGDRFSAFVLAIVRSDAFGKRRAAPTTGGTR